jgi:uncharacterized SAM-binding protein YcdF (DUF218 family)
MCLVGILLAASSWWLPYVYLAIRYPPDPPVPADAILIEGWVFHEELIALTADLYSRGYGKVVIATGERFGRLRGLIGVETWAAATKKDLMSRGVPEPSIIAVDQTQEGTYGSALAARTEFQHHEIHSVLIITEPLHLLRTCKTYRKVTRDLALNISCLTHQPARMTPESWWQSRSGWAVMAREYAALAYYTIHGYF